MKNPFENALSQLERAAAVRPFPDAFMKRISAPEREIRIAIPVIMDDGHTEVFEGYRVEHNNARSMHRRDPRLRQCRLVCG